jgi:gliding motility-associated lipoprotein GldH
MNFTDKRVLLFFLPLIWCITACTTIDLYEKNVTIPGHSWSSEFKPEFTFTIKDTSVPYQLFLVLRHTDKYNYRNIYINLYTQQPGIDTTSKIRFDLTLATDEKGWLATGMDDIYEHRLTLTPPGYFRRSGTYTYTVEQIMREDPLESIMNVGLRIEKITE